MSGAPEAHSLARVSRYYGEKLRQHGASPQGVDWNGAESQRLRFGELLRIRSERREYSLNDLGCGYGALADYIGELGERCDYLGVDISPAMIEQARELHRGRTGWRFLAGERADRSADYSVASGIFNVKLDTPPAAWREHVLRTLDAIDQASTRGFAFNCLTQYSDAERMRPHLYYADPCEVFDYCKRRFSRNVALLHDYGLYEFTLLVRKDLGA
jgi:SAM-dependent methyltransferase